MALIPFYIVLIILLVLSIFVPIIVYHFAKYRLSEEHHRVLTAVFVVGFFILTGLELLLFFSVSWADVASAVQEWFQSKNSANIGL